MTINSHTESHMRLKDFHTEFYGLSYRANEIVIQAYKIVIQAYKIVIQAYKIVIQALIDLHIIKLNRQKLRDLIFSFFIYQTQRTEQPPEKYIFIASNSLRP